MKPCLPRLNRHVNAIGDDVNSGGKKKILREKKKNPKIHNIKKPEPDPVAFTEKDPTKEIIDLLTPFWISFNAEEKYIIFIFFLFYGEFWEQR